MSVRLPPLLERARLDASLERSVAQARAGQLIDADVVLGKLLARR